MTCTDCGGETSVVDSRPAKAMVRRRRKCLACGARVTTYEVTAADLETLRGNRDLTRWLQDAPTAIRELFARGS